MSGCNRPAKIVRKILSLRRSPLAAQLNLLYVKKNHINPRTRLAKNSRFRNVLNSKKQLEFLYAVFLRRFLILLFTLFFLCHFLMWLVAYNNIQQMMRTVLTSPLHNDSKWLQRSRTSCLKTTATMPSPSQTLSREQGIFATIPLPSKKRPKKARTKTTSKHAISSLSPLLANGAFSVCVETPPQAVT